MPIIPFGNRSNHIRSLGKSKRGITKRYIRSISVSEGGGGSSPTFVRAVAATPTQATTLTIPSVQVDGTNKLLVVFVTSYVNPNNGVSGITFNTSENFTQVSGSELAWGDGNEKTEAWFLIAPTSATADIVISFGGDNSFCAAVAYVINGANQTTPCGTVSTNTTASGTSLSTSPSSTTSNLVLAALGYYTSQTYTPGGSQIAPTGGDSDGGGTESIRVTYKAGEASSTTMSWSWSSGTEAAIIAFAINS